MVFGQTTQRKSAKSIPETEEQISDSLEVHCNPQETVSIRVVIDLRTAVLFGRERMEFVACTETKY